MRKLEMCNSRQLEKTTTKSSGNDTYLNTTQQTQTITKTLEYSSRHLLLNSLNCAHTKHTKTHTVVSHVQSTYKSKWVKEIWRTDVLFQVSSCGWYSCLIFLQDKLLRAKAIVLYVRRPVQHARIEVECLQFTVTADNWLSPNSTWLNMTHLSSWCIFTVQRESCWTMRQMCQRLSLWNSLIPALHGFTFLYSGHACQENKILN